jgi:hypothetical protein
MVVADTAGEVYMESFGLAVRRWVSHQTQRVLGFDSGDV